MPRRPLTAKDIPPLTVTVGDLVEALMKFPSKTPVVLHGYEDGYEPLYPLEFPRDLICVAENIGDYWYNGHYRRPKENERGVGVVLLG